MSFIQHMKFKKTNKDSLDLLPWIETLSPDEQTEFFEAQARQLANRQRVINDGRMSVDCDDYIWTDKSSFENQNHGADLIWQKYFERWLKETDTQMITTFTEE
jgi:hypothetical protein